jgi:catechol 2,3-dioxygenase-like lactoylglutathione lyase family enzyme
MNITHVAGFAPIVRDLEASARFYREALGLPLPEGDYPMTDDLPELRHFGLWTLADAAQSCFGTDEWPADVPEPQGSLEFDVAGADELAQAATELEAAGHRILTGPKAEPWGQTVVRLLSPEGLLVSITHTPWQHGVGLRVSGTRVARGGLAGLHEESGAERRNDLDRALASDYREVPVERQHAPTAALRAGDNCCVGKPEWEIGVTGDQLAYAGNVNVAAIKEIGAGLELCEERTENMDAEPPLKEGRHLSQDACGNHKRFSWSSKHRGSRGMPLILSVDRRNERRRVDRDHSGCQCLASHSS